MSSGGSPHRARCPLDVVLEYRATLSNEWKTQAGDGTIPSGNPRSPAVQSGTVEWNTTELPEGLYDIRLAVSDQAANDPTEGHRAIGPIRRVAVDRSAPSIEVRRLRNGRFEVHPETAPTPIGAEDRTRPPRRRRVFG